MTRLQQRHDRYGQSPWLDDLGVADRAPSARRFALAGFALT